MANNKNKPGETHAAQSNVGQTPIRTGGTLATPEPLVRQHQRFPRPPSPKTPDAPTAQQ